MRYITDANLKHVQLFLRIQCIDKYINTNILNLAHSVTSTFELKELSTEEISFYHYKASLKYYFITIMSKIKFIFNISTHKLVSRDIYF